jgi:hypothetical protein
MIILLVIVLSPATCGRVVLLVVEPKKKGFEWWYVYVMSVACVLI